MHVCNHHNSLSVSNMSDKIQVSAHLMQHSFHV